MSEEQEKRRRGIYLLPNLFTTGALFAGFYAIIAAINGKFDDAAMAVFIAMVMDGLDGRVARLTNTQSDFGSQYDSLADLISFGLAPALVMYSWALNGLGKPGWLAAFLYTAAAALRLARFNTQLGNGDKRYFQGLASPASAALVVGMVWVFHDFEIPGRQMDWYALVVTIVAGLLMVSNFRYRSFKDLDLKNRVPFVAVLMVVLVYMLISIHPPQVLFGFALFYALSGPVGTLWSLRQYRARRAQKKQSDSQ